MCSDLWIWFVQTHCNIKNHYLFILLWVALLSVLATWRAPSRWISMHHPVQAKACSGWDSLCLVHMHGGHLLPIALFYGDGLLGPWWDSSSCSYLIPLIELVWSFNPHQSFFEMDRCYTVMLLVFLWGLQARDIAAHACDIILLHADATCNTITVHSFGEHSHPFRLMGVLFHPHRGLQGDYK